MEEWIKKSDVVKAFEDVLDCDFFHVSEETPRERIEAIPSADRPRGELKYMGTYYKCSVCGGEFMDEITFMGELNYCPACGCSWKGADDEAD